MRSIVIFGLAFFLLFQNTGSALAGVITYSDQSSFLAAAGSVSTQTFDSFASGDLGSNVVVFDGVQYFGPPGSNPIGFPNQYAIIGSVFDGLVFTDIRPQTLSFQGGYTNAIGFLLDFPGGSADVFPNNFQIAVTETTGAVTLDMLSVGGTISVNGSSTIPPPFYVGFTSDVGIESVSLGYVPDGPAPVNWSYDDVSHGPISSTPEPSTLAVTLTGAGLIGLFLVRRRPYQWESLETEATDTPLRSQGKESERTPSVQLWIDTADLPIGLHRLLLAVDARM